MRQPTSGARGAGGRPAGDGSSGRGVEPAPLPRELVLASAGTGKTFRVSSRILGLLGREGTLPEHILASTFTRKAAGEILDRVLDRLAEAALDPERCRELARHLALEPEEASGAGASRAGADTAASVPASPGTGVEGTGSGDARLDPDGAAELLAWLLGRLHRLDIGTLDAFIVRAVRVFGPELAMPPGWGIGDDVALERLRSEAVQRLLAEGERGELVELLRMLARGRVERRIHDRLVEELGRLHGLHRELEEGPIGEGEGKGPGEWHPDPWRPFPEVDAPSGRRSAGRGAGAADGGPGAVAGDPGPTRGGSETARDGTQAARDDSRAARDDPEAARDDPEAARRELAARLEAVEIPLTSRGTPNRNWAGALPAAAEALREGRWEILFGKGPGKNFLEGGSRYGRVDFPPELVGILEEARRLARVELAPVLNAQGAAMGRLAARYGAHREAVRRAAGLFGFDDLAHRLAGEGGLTGREAMAYRLGRRARHLLLDEFQDTSPLQWRAIRPLADRLLGDPDGTADGPGAAVVVADPKQSIYGWRGADPDLVGRVGARYGLAEERLGTSWRSGPEVLDFVNRVFGAIGENPVLAAIEGGTEVARRWAGAFEPHRPAPPLEDRPGHVRLEVGPRDPGRGGARPLLRAFAARRVAELHRAAPGADIGVLTRTNRTVARMVHELGALGVEVSEEGGVSVDDAAPASALLALLTLADHPGDRIARYHVARGPLGELLDYRDPFDDAAAGHLSHRVRRRLLEAGYGGSLDGWVRSLAPRVDARELRRLDQLVGLGFRWEERATLRPGDFVRYVRSQRVEHPAAARVRVMTVHQAKGLEFDLVVLPELSASLLGRSGGVALPERDRETGRLLRVFPPVRKALRPLFPELEEAVRQDRALRLRDGLSHLYVALTRARHALHLVLPADAGGGSGTAKSQARLVRAALGILEERLEEGRVAYERGRADWYRSEGLDVARPSLPLEAGGLRMEEADGGTPGAEPPSPKVDPRLPRRRLLARSRPSALGEETGPVRAADLLRLGREKARRRGELVHAWCREISWLEEETPTRERLVALAERTAAGPEREVVEEAAERFLAWLEAPEVREALSRRAAAARLGAPASTLELWRERPFARREGERVVSGVLDRVVVARGERAIAAEVLDFKTDALDAGDEEALEGRVEAHRPQLEAYRRAVAAATGLSPGRVAARLVFLAAERVRDL